MATLTRRRLVSTGGARAGAAAAAADATAGTAATLAAVAPTARGRTSHNRSAHRYATAPAGNSDAPKERAQVSGRESGRVSSRVTERETTGLLSSKDHEPDSPRVIVANGTADDGRNSFARRSSRASDAVANSNCSEADDGRNSFARRNSRSGLVVASSYCSGVGSLASTSASSSSYCSALGSSASTHGSSRTASVGRALEQSPARSTSPSFSEVVGKRSPFSGNEFASAVRLAGVFGHRDVLSLKAQSGERTGFASGISGALGSLGERLRTAPLDDSSCVALPDSGSSSGSAASEAATFRWDENSVRYEVLGSVFGAEDSSSAARDHGCEVRLVATSGHIMGKADKKKPSAKGTAVSDSKAQLMLIPAWAACCSQSLGASKLSSEGVVAERRVRVQLVDSEGSGISGAVRDMTIEYRLDAAVDTIKRNIPNSMLSGPNSPSDPLSVHLDISVPTTVLGFSQPPSSCLSLTSGGGYAGYAAVSHPAFRLWCPTQPRTEDLVLEGGFTKDVVVKSVSCDSLAFRAGIRPGFTLRAVASDRDMFRNGPASIALSSARYPLVLEFQASAGPIPPSKDSVPSSSFRRPKQAIATNTSMSVASAATCWTQQAVLGVRLTGILRSHSEFPGEGGAQPRSQTLKSITLESLTGTCDTRRHSTGSSSQAPISHASGAGSARGMSLRKPDAERNTLPARLSNCRDPSFLDDDDHDLGLLESPLSPPSKCKPPIDPSKFQSADSVSSPRTKSAAPGTSASADPALTLPAIVPIVKVPKRVLKREGRVTCLEWTAKSRGREVRFMEKSLEAMLTSIERWVAMQSPDAWELLHVCPKNSGDRSSRGAGRGCPDCCTPWRVVSLGEEAMLLADKPQSGLATCLCCGGGGRLHPPLSLLFCAGCTGYRVLCDLCCETVEPDSSPSEILSLKAEVKAKDLVLADLIRSSDQGACILLTRSAVSKYEADLARLLAVSQAQVQVRVRGAPDADLVTLEVEFLHVDFVSSAKRKRAQWMCRNRPPPLLLFLELRSLFKHAGDENPMQGALAQLVGVEALKAEQIILSGQAETEMPILMDALLIKDFNTIEEQLYAAMSAAFNACVEEKADSLLPHVFVSLIRVLRTKVQESGGEKLGCGADGSGALNQEEFLQALINLADADGDGTIDADEFISAVEEVVEALAWDRQVTLQCLKQLTEKDKASQVLFQKTSQKISVLQNVVQAQDGNSSGMEATPKQLIAAVKKGDIELVRKHLLTGVDVNIREGPCAPIHAAAQMGNGAIVTLLAQFRSNVDALSGISEAPLEIALRTLCKNASPAVSSNGSCEAEVMLAGSAFEVLVERSAQVPARTTVLFEVVTKNLATLIPTLVTAGADVNKTDEKGRTAADVAWQEDKLSAFMALVELGARLEVCIGDSIREAVTKADSKLQNQDVAAVVSALIIARGSMEEVDDDGETVLHLAARGFPADGCEALATGAKKRILGWLSDRGHSCLDVAVSEFRYDAAHAFHSAGAPLESQRASCLFHPVQRGDLVAVKSLLSAMAEVNEVNGQHEFLLSIAAHWGYAEICAELLTNPHTGVLSGGGARKIDPLLRNDNDNTALHVACLRGETRAVEAILQGLEGVPDLREALLSRQNFRGFTALDVAMRLGNEELQQALMNSGGQSKKVGMQVFFAALENSDFAKAMEMLKSGNVDLQGQNKQGWKAVHAVAAAGAEKMVPVLAEMKADFNATAMYTAETPLHFAAARNHVEVIKAILSPFHFSSENEITMVEPINVNAETLERSTPLDVVFSLSADKRDEALCRLLLKNGGRLQQSKTVVLHQACVDGIESWTRLSIEGGADLNGSRVDDKALNAPIHVAALHGHAGLCTILLKANADVSQENKVRQTPLHLATSFAVVEVLVEGRADVNASDRWLQTPLHVSCNAGLHHVVRGLLLAKVGPSRADKGDSKLDTPAHLAVRAGHFDVVSQLLAHATLFPLPRNEAGETALDCAKKIGFNEMVKAIVAGVGKHELLEEEPSN